MNSTDYPARHRAENHMVYNRVVGQLKPQDRAMLDSMLAVAYCDGKLDALHETRAMNTAESERPALLRRQAE